MSRLLLLFALASRATAFAPALARIDRSIVARAAHLVVPQQSRAVSIAASAVPAEPEEPPVQVGHVCRNTCGPSALMRRTTWS